MGVERSETHPTVSEQRREYANQARIARESGQSDLERWAAERDAALADLKGVLLDLWLVKKIDQFCTWLAYRLDRIWTR